MNSYKVKFSKDAEKFIKKNKLIGVKFFKAFHELSQSKDTCFRYDIKKFHSSEYSDIFRLRIGKYRAIFRIIEEEIVIFVIDIDSRGGIYKI